MDTPGRSSAEDLQRGRSMEARDLRRRCRVSATIPQEVIAAFHRWLTGAPAAHRYPGSRRPSRRSAASCAGAAKSIITTRPSPISARSTMAPSAESLWRVPMTPKQRKAKNAYERERRRLHRLHRFEVRGSSTRVHACRRHRRSRARTARRARRRRLRGRLRAALDQRAQRLQTGPTRGARRDSGGRSKCARPRGPWVARASPRSIA